MGNSQDKMSYNKNQANLQTQQREITKPGPLARHSRANLPLWAKHDMRVDPYTSAMGKQYYFERNLRDKYGITVVDYLDLADRQDFKCAICVNVLRMDRSTVVDHCHDTGKVRGLLCRACNSGIGQLKDNPTLLKRGARYIEQHS